MSLPPQFSVILEKFFVNELGDFLAKYQLFCDHKYQFRSNRSTFLAVMEFVRNTATDVDKKQRAVGVCVRALDITDLLIS